MPKVALSPGRSALYCPKCETHLSKYKERDFLSEYDVTCSKCGNRMSEYDIAVSVIPTSEKFLRVGAVRESLWYHSTSRENWHDNVPDDVPIYLGTRAAAKARRSHTRTELRDEEAFLYTLKLKRNVPILRSVTADDYLNDHYTYPKYAHQVVRYVNMFESVGSISLITRRDHFEIVKCVPAD